MKSHSDEMHGEDTEENWKAQLKTLCSDVAQKKGKVTVLKTEIKSPGETT